jgi:hypothetical protein
MAVPLTREKDQPLLEERLVIELSFQPNEQQETGDTSDIRIGISLVDNNETEWYASHFRGLCAALAGALSDV